MRFPGENAAGQASARRRRPSGRDAASRTGRRAGEGQPAGESSLFIPGYRDDRQAAADPVPDDAGSGRLAAVGTAGREHPDTGFEPGYSDLAVNDPAADATSTQTWGAVGDGNQPDSWTSQRAPADARPPAD